MSRISSRVKHVSRRSDCGVPLSVAMKPEATESISMSYLRSCAPFSDSLGIMAERTVNTPLQDVARSGEWKQASHTVATFSTA
ncbi:MAG: hypothetical protein K0R47_1821 [Brevibacillus sp.]|nr:hypothetical protein [Brevibacillus sp.]